MEGAIIGAALSVVVAVLGSHMRMSQQLRGVGEQLKAVTERLDRAAIEDTRDRVTRLEVRVDQLALR